MVVNDTHKQAAKSAIARGVVAGVDPVLVAIGVHQASRKLSLQLGNFGSAETMFHYAQGVQANGEQVSNRKWASYPRETQALSSKISYEAIKVARAEGVGA